VNRSEHGHPGTAADRGLLADEALDPTAVGTSTAGGRAAVGVVGAVLGTAALLLARWVVLAQRMVCGPDPEIGGAAPPCVAVTDTMKTVENWWFLGGIGVVWVIAALAALGLLTTIGGQSAGQDHIDEGERP